MNPIFRRRFFSLALVTLFGAAAYVGAEPVGVGMTAEVKDVLLPGPELRVKPDPSGRSPVVLRVTAVYPHGTAGFRYDFSWFAYEAGKHDLTKFLERVDGTATGEMPPVEVEAVSSLPLGAPGRLSGFSAPVPKLGGYRTLLVTGGLVWVAAFIGLLCWRRRKERADGEMVETAIPLVDRLRPLLEKARTGSLDAEGRARLERLVLGFWRQRLGMENLPVPLAVRQLREHAEAGALLRKVEEWLHSGRASASEAAVADLLTPYLSAPAIASPNAQPPSSPALP